LSNDHPISNANPNPNPNPDPNPTPDPNPIHLRAAFFEVTKFPTTKIMIWAKVTAQPQPHPKC